MIGVVLIHSNLGISSDLIGIGIMDFLSSKLTKICVPGFFFLSGWLFFRNLKNHVTQKLKRRATTVLIPYLLWNLIGLGLVLLKAHLSIPGVSSYESLDMSFPQILKGFFALNLIGGEVSYPFEFVFWFIRNLIIYFVIGVIIWKIFNLRYWMLIIFAIAASFRFYFDSYGLIIGFIFFYSGGIIGNKVIDGNLNFFTQNKVSKKIIAGCFLSLYLIYIVFIEDINIFFGNYIITPFFYPTLILGIFRPISDSKLQEIERS